MSASFEQGSEAQYNGQFFDSFTEAAWAVYFDVAGIPYVREPETFDITINLGPDKEPFNRLYTPDYYLPDTDMYVEVKNGRINNEAFLKLMALAAGTGRVALLADGMPWSAMLSFYGPHPDEARTLSKRYSDIQVPRTDWLTSKNTGDPVLRQAVADNMNYAMNSMNRVSAHIDPSLRMQSKDRKRAMRQSMVQINV